MASKSHIEREVAAPLLWPFDAPECAQVPSNRAGRLRKVFEIPVNTEQAPTMVSARRNWKSAIRFYTFNAGWAA
jgi:hypothetical protein